MCVLCDVCCMMCIVCCGYVSGESYIPFKHCLCHAQWLWLVWPWLTIWKRKVVTIVCHITDLSLTPTINMHFLTQALVQISWFFLIWLLWLLGHPLRFILDQNALSTSVPALIISRLLLSLFWLVFLFFFWSLFCFIVLLFSFIPPCLLALAPSFCLAFFTVAF